jgi:hypothetical protein
MIVIPYLLLTALIHVESGGNDRALGDYVQGAPTRFGCLQIGDEVLADVRRISGHWVSRPDAFDRAKASQICVLYLSYWCEPSRLGHEPTMEDFARVWNGGPEGHRKQSTITYWHRVERVLAQISQARLPVAGQNRNPRLPTIGAGLARVRTDTVQTSGAYSPPIAPANRDSLSDLGYFTSPRFAPRRSGNGASH